ncbi:Beta-galactosidase C-terminal domain [Micromonospora sp. 4G55]|uniref:Beta-galactosidase C-terminal domain n=1 Tax=Micromonospora sp. 4G55 TaxID=2806102 RepID=UPI001EE4735A|nr:Beta-galactosidase C-terminal domain [Micromonospora sp. 4G55]
MAAPTGVEVVRRRAGDRSWLFAINHTDAEVRLDVTGTELLGGARCAGELRVPAGEVAVVREGHVGPVPLGEPTATA